MVAVERITTKFSGLVGAHGSEEEASFLATQQDETRHIGCGIWFLRETVAAHPEQADTVRATLRELLPSVAAALTPPDRAEKTDWDALGANADELRGSALDGLTRPLDIIGAPLARL